MADFETLNTDDCTETYVWAWCESTLFYDDIYHGTSMVSFMESLYRYDRLYFHNEKFDSSFIVDWMLRHGFTYWHDRPQDMQERTFQAIRSENGVIYRLQIKYHNHLVDIRDSMKLLPFSVRDMADGWGLPITKGDIDYKLYRPRGYEPTYQEWDYIDRDVLIVKQVLEFMYREGYQELTIGAAALNDWKRRLSDFMDESTAQSLFPAIPLDIDQYLRESYRGGFVWVNPKYKGIDVGQGQVYDCNSMHPSQMRYKPMPVGKPCYFTGSPHLVHPYSLYIAKVRIWADLKPDHIPVISKMRSVLNLECEYLDHVEGLELTLTSVDIDLITDQYDCTIEYIDGYMFQARTGMFDSFIDYWMDIKANSKGARRQLAKLMLNNLYGKFGSRIMQSLMEPVIVKDAVRWVKYMDTTADPVYLPIAIFVTAYSRDTVIRAGQACYKDLCYIDTDSLHIIGTAVPSIDIHKTKLGAWKHESDFRRARFLRCKRYIEDTAVYDKKGDFLGYELVVKCGGMNKECKEQVTWDNFKAGSIFNKKLLSSVIKGGTVLRDTTFKLS